MFGTLEHAHDRGDHGRAARRHAPDGRRRRQRGAVALGQRRATTIASAGERRGELQRDARRRRCPTRRGCRPGRVAASATTSDATISAIAPRAPRVSPRRAGVSAQRSVRAPAGCGPPAACCCSSIAIVIGPTPPGTGGDRRGELARPPRSRRRRRGRSCCRPRSGVRRFMPTSMTTAPGAMKSPLDHPRPADRGDQAPRPGAQTAARSRVREWQTVTVAFACEQQLCHRLAEEVRAADHDRLGAFRASTPARAQQLHHASGVQGRRPGRPSASRPALTGVRPSTSLAGAISAVRSRRRAGPGAAAAARIPLTALSASGRRARSATSAVRRVGRQADVEGAHADLLAGPLLARDVDRRRRVFSDQHGGKARRRARAGHEVRWTSSATLGPDAGGDRLAVDEARITLGMLRSLWRSAGVPAPSRGQGRDSGA